MKYCIQFIWTTVLIFEVLILFFSNVVYAMTGEEQIFFIQMSRQLVSPISAEVTATSGIHCACLCADLKQCRGASYDTTTHECRMSDQPVCALTQANKSSMFMTKKVRMCDPGWEEFNGHCYYFELTTKKTWLDAKKYCPRFGSYFVKIENECENNWIKDMLKKHANNDVLIGASDIEREGQMIWTVDKTEVVYGDWIPGEPDNFGVGEDCIMMQKTFNFRWMDIYCSAGAYYICEK